MDRLNENPDPQPYDQTQFEPSATVDDPLPPPTDETYFVADNQKAMNSQYEPSENNHQPTPPPPPPQFMHPQNPHTNVNVSQPVPYPPQNPQTNGTMPVQYPPQNPQTNAAQPVAYPPQNPQTYTTQPVQYPPQNPQTNAAQPVAYPPQNQQTYATQPVQFPPQSPQTVPPPPYPSPQPYHQTNPQQYSYPPQAGQQPYPSQAAGPQPFPLAAASQVPQSASFQPMSQNGTAQVGYQEMQYKPGAPAGFPMPNQYPTEGWKTGLFHCLDDPGNALVTACFPCVTFGQIAEIIDNGQPSCWTSGLLYGLIAAFIGCPCIMSCSYRSKLRNRYGLIESPAPDWLTHFFCEWCALCQEYRELQVRGMDPTIGWHGNLVKNQNIQMPQAAMMPPTNQTMMG